MLLQGHSLSLVTVEDPNDWTKENVTPILKKGKKEDLGSRRLVSPSSVPAEVIQQILFQGSSKHRKKRKLIGNNQHGFTKGK